MVGRPGCLTAKIVSSSFSVIQATTETAGGQPSEETRDLETGSSFEVSRVRVRMACRRSMKNDKCKLAWGETKIISPLPAGCARRRASPWKRSSNPKLKIPGGSLFWTSLPRAQNMSTSHEFSALREIWDFFACFFRRPISLTLSRRPCSCRARDISLAGCARGRAKSHTQPYATEVLLRSTSEFQNMRQNM